MVCPPPDDDKTTVLEGDETLNRELEKAKEADACLIIIRGTPQGHRFFINKGEMTIGRDPAVEISITDPSISRKHAKILRSGNQVLITDLGSANGTVINGEKMKPGDTAPLGKEDLIRLGNSVLKFLPAGAIEILFHGNMQAAAHTDPLTKIYNRRYFTEALDAEFKRAKALSGPLSLIYFDLDHFKKVNDTYGHDAGDYVLKEITAFLKRKNIGEKDVFARIGGEEFVILLRNAGLEEAKASAEKIREAVETHAFIYEGTRLPITVSMGVTSLGEAMDSPQALVNSADKALYGSKTGGRNRVTVAQ